MIKIISQKLYLRVALSIALVAIVVSIVSSMLSYYSDLKEKKNTNYLLVQQLAHTVEKTATIAAYLNDQELSQEIINGLLSNDIVQGASIGIAVAPNDGNELLKLMFNADQMLYQVKETGRGNVAFYGELKNKILLSILNN
ncbi:hypothetical protein ATS72_003675 [Pseudoalteromonas sp. 13-15]|uniref:diguanylate cyclase domain-containing protein n=1 Tax=Pseudoalteromonas TaxID=53246 RepID=UPI00073146CF|nr:MULTISPECIES: diguanylate cyclase [Pseudoalteromonas]AUL72752.1 hypothetical protein ATS72_003675 [Pseudoalteromonas sp. 13-15]WFO20292.1 diguanylate cyclase [Pseudoalteromonas sp. H100]